MSRLRLLAYVIAFGMAVTAMLNSMPSVWIIPQIGPLTAEYLRAGMFVGSVLVVLLTTGFTVWASERHPAWRWPALAFDVLLLATAIWVAYEFAVVNIEIQDSLFFFDAYHGWVTLAAIVVITILCWKVWGLPLAVFCVIATLYYFTGHYWPGLLNIIERSFTDALPEDIKGHEGRPEAKVLRMRQFLRPACLARCPVFRSPTWLALA